MAKYYNREVTKLIGQRLKKCREEAELEIEDLAQMTGFHRNTIISIENGANTDISHFIGYSFALNMHPKDILNIPLNVKPRYPLSGKRKEKNKLTSNVRLLNREGFFKKPRSSKDVCDELIRRNPKAVHMETKNMSVILRREVAGGNLKSNKVGKTNLYKAVKKK